MSSLGAVGSSASEQAGNEAIKANDGNLATRWAANDGTYPKTWKVNLGAVKTLSKLEGLWYGGTGRSYKYFVEVAGANEVYTEVIDRRTRTLGGDSSDDFAAGTTAQWVRITVTGATAGFASAFEFRVIGH